MEKLVPLLAWLQGKKSTMVSIGSAILVYVNAAGLIDTNMHVLLQTILSILGGSAAVATNQAVKLGKLGSRK